MISDSQRQNIRLAEPKELGQILAEVLDVIAGMEDDDIETVAAELTTTGDDRKVTLQVLVREL